MSDDEVNEDERTCPECDGTLIEDDDDVYCNTCHVMPASTRMHPDDPWHTFGEQRPEYRNSTYRRCVGGFPGTYEWVRSADIDCTVRELDPHTFYNGR